MMHTKTLSNGGCIPAETIINIPSSKTGTTVLQSNANWALGNKI